MRKLNWTPHFTHVAFAICGLVVFHVVGFMANLFPTSALELFYLAVFLFLLPCLITSILYSVALQWYFPRFFQGYANNKLFHLSGFIQGASAYPISIQISALPFGLVTDNNNFIVAVLLTNTLSLVFPIMLAFTYGKINHGKPHV